MQQDVGGGLNSVAPEHYSDNLSFSLKEIYLIYWKANENSMAFSFVTMMFDFESES